MTTETDLKEFYDTDSEGNEYELVRPESKSYEDVIQCIEHHGKKPHKAVDMFLEMYRSGLKWDQFEEYKDWKEKCTEIEATNERMVAVEGEEVSHYPLPDEPKMAEDKTEELRNYWNKCLQEG